MMTQNKSKDAYRIHGTNTTNSVVHIKPINLSPRKGELKTISKGEKLQNLPKEKHENLNFCQDPDKTSYDEVLISKCTPKLEEDKTANLPAKNN